ncbi:hypothetical protein ACRTCC_000277 [Clostridium perfringens]|jgi:hypothetical protein|uniref:hypothetical protein n=1 Tax=Clostridium perfringens TaxID=1502 RepID=UPI000DA26B38|nr:hypothetical protein [Clostridium perfringens]MBI6014488.1 hypothetical protein [Clostridium perfringens]MBO3364312.1 hypothetical protein [Clostridium perfringens]MCX0409983.1 hypothetical protein [Clostridium perfringens]MDH2460253.1 hypothetical protein [Clostridium perfringens]MDH5080554.1 hypothetical protein [Clostridium perfringens]
MDYVDSSYYRENFKGIILNDDTLENRLERAADQIDVLTYNRIIGIGFENLSPFQQDKIKKAVCLQAEFIEQYGEFINMPLSGYSAGSTSVSFNGSIVNGITTTKEVINYISQTGLNSRRL